MEHHFDVFPIRCFSVVRVLGDATPIRAFQKEREHLSAEYAARHFLGFSPGWGPPPPQKLESIFSTFAALNLAVIDTVMGHVNVHMDFHLISCYASLYRASSGLVYTRGGSRGASRMRRNYGDAAAHHSTCDTQQHRRTYQHQQQAHRRSNTPQKATHAPAAAWRWEGRRRCTCRQFTPA